MPNERILATTLIDRDRQLPEKRCLPLLDNPEWRLVFLRCTCLHRQGWKQGSFVDLDLEVGNVDAIGCGRDIRILCKAAFDRLSDGKDKEFVAVTHKDYADTVEMIQFVDEMRKKRS